MRTIVYFVIEGVEPFDVLNPDWKRVKVLTLWDRLDVPAKRLVDASLANGIPIKCKNPVARESIDQYITGRND